MWLANRRIAFGARGTSASTLGAVFMDFWRQGYICRHPWLRFRWLSEPGVQLPAPLVPLSGIFGARGTTSGPLAPFPMAFGANATLIGKVEIDRDKQRKSHRLSLGV